MQRQFETHGPIDAIVEIGRGRVRVDAHDTTETVVVIEGEGAEAVEVGFEGNTLHVIAPKHGGIFSRDNRLDVRVSLPTDSSLAVKTGSADIEVSGRLHAGRLKTGSGDVTADTFTGEASIDTGSGDIGVSEAGADLQVKSGSGDVSVGRCAGDLAVSTGSGDVEVGQAFGRAAVKTGSGDLKVETAESDVSLSTGSGDMHIGTARRGRLVLKGASSDVHVGVPAGTPVWTDVNTVTGSIRTNIDSVGAPQEGQDHVEIEARTVSGDIVLAEA